MTRAWAAVVVNFEPGPLLTECVRSVLADTSAGEVELVVVDNRSHDGSIEALQTAFPEVRVISSPGNVGYARAANLGIAATRAPVVAVFNPDLTIEPGTAKAMRACFDDEPRLGAAGPRIRNVDGSDYPSARKSPSIPVAVGHGLFGLWWPANPFTARYRELGADPAQPRSVDWVSGAAIWLRRATLDAVGGWDERYFMYMEDLDLCRRIRGAGFDVAYEPAGGVIHVQGASTSKHPYRMLAQHHRSAWTFARRRLTGAAAVFLPFAALYLVARCGLAMAEHAWHAVRADRPRE
ncbi:MAG: N-acetylglucosaminyl-diphospho-decaprenol L-rhamnosyltransferase [Actinomycetota bacterium]|nr:N-acetylglucosaminyl-diphospho-decaprenol L-rhamnosyltransferase [Actinomycetota bacterium]